MQGQVRIDVMLRAIALRVVLVDMQGRRLLECHTPFRGALRKLLAVLRLRPHQKLAFDSAMQLEQFSFALGRECGRYYMPTFGAIVWW
jgi:hypothetical protein